MYSDIEKAYEAKQVQKIIGTNQKMLRIYKKTMRDIAYQIKIYEAKQLLSPEKYGAQLARSKGLKKELSRIMNALEKEISETMTGSIKSNWDLANQKNDIIASKFSALTKYYNVNSEALKAFLNRDVGGLISHKLYNITASTKSFVNDYLATGITQGKPVNKIAKEMNTMIKNPKGVNLFRYPRQKGQYSNPYKSLLRLARTETTAAYRLSDHTRMQQLDFVVGKEVHLSGAHKDYDMCDYMAGKYPKNFVFSGWHPNCLCYVTSILMTKEEFKSGKLGSKNEVKRIPPKAEKYVKSSGDKFDNSDWKKTNFTKDNKPISSLGGSRSNIDKYKLPTKDDYNASPVGFLSNAKEVN